jgi:hypothetical protein
LTFPPKVVGVKFKLYTVYALGFTQPLTEMNTRSIKMFLGSKARAGA